MLTLFQAVSGGISWEVISDPLVEIHWINGIVVLFYIFFTIYALTNIITGIFVDTAIKNAHNDKQEVIQAHMQNRKKVMEELAKFFEEADGDSDGNITLEELHNHMKNEEVRACLEELGLEVNEARSLFQLLDMDGDGIVNIDEFILGATKVLGHAKASDLVLSMSENKRMMDTIMQQFQGMRKSSDQRDTELRELTANMNKALQSLSENGRAIRSSRSGESDAVASTMSELQDSTARMRTTLEDAMRRSAGTCIGDRAVQTV